MFGSNSYPGLIDNESIVNRTIESVKEYGVGSGGVPSLSGTFDVHYELGKTLSDLTGFGDSLLFSSGFTANIGAISGIVREHNLIIHDKFNHASLLDGAKMIRYRHNDPAHPEKLRAGNVDEYGQGIEVFTRYKLK